MRGGPDFHNMAGFLTETAALPLRDAALLRAGGGSRDLRRAAQEPAGEDPERQLHEPVAGRLLAAAPARRIHAHGLARDARSGGAAERRLPLQHLADGHAPDRQGREGAGRPLRVRHRPGARSTIPRGRWSSCARSGSRTSRFGRPTRHSRPAASTYPAGTYVIGPHSFRPYVVDLIEPKKFPERRLYPGGPPDPPYDMTGYELSLQMGVKIDRVEEPFPLPARVVDEIPPAPGGVQGSGHRGLRAGPEPEHGREGAQPTAEGWRHGLVGRRQYHRSCRAWHVMSSISEGKESRRGVQGARCAAGRREADSDAAHRPLSQLPREHGRGLDAVDSRAVRVPLHQPVERRRSRRPLEVRRAALRGRVRGRPS